MSLDQSLACFPGSLSIPGIFLEFCLSSMVGVGLQYQVFQQKRQKYAPMSKILKFLFDTTSLVA